MKFNNKNSWSKLLVLSVLSMTIYSHINSAHISYAKEETKLAIVIDDFGNNMQGSEEILNLPLPLTIAVMPFMPTTKQDAELAHKNGKEVIIHLPMEANRGKASWLGPGAILSHLSDEEIKQRVEAAIADVPHAVGMNNHMGSKITQNKHIMRIILSVCKEHNLYYLDSKTSDKSIVAEVSEELGIPYIKNDIFLDHHYDQLYISRQMQQVLNMVKIQTRTVAIGHVGPPGRYTSQALYDAISELTKSTEVVPLTTIIEDSIIDDEIM